MKEVGDVNPGKAEGFKKNNFLLLTPYCLSFFFLFPLSLGDLMKEAKLLPSQPRLPACYSHALGVV